MFPKSSIETKLDAEINSLLSKLKETPKGSEDYNKLVEQISKLHKLKSDEKKDQIKLPSLDTCLYVSANIFGILWITRYEKERVLNSKALPFVMKPR